MIDPYVQGGSPNHIDVGRCAAYCGELLERGDTPFWIWGGLALLTALVFALWKPARGRVGGGILIILGVLALSTVAFSLIEWAQLDLKYLWPTDIVILSGYLLNTTLGVFWTLLGLKFVVRWRA